jgi:Fe2+ or Zn2+ uptake regulation protein
VQEVPVSVLGGFTEGLDAEAGFEVDVAHLTVFGTCRKCR